MTEVIDAAHLARQREWSKATFGPGDRLLGVLDHIRKELKEIEDDPADLGEWVDVVILAFDGAWRAGWEPQQIIDAIKAKQARNEAREWPDWRTASADRAIEHTPATLADAIHKVMADAPPGGMTAVDVLNGMRERWPDAWPLISMLDIHDEMSKMYGKPIRDGG